jgi:phosphopantothenoylcysteine decarboxylase/phosphopantothenate--cysteine ligase
LLSTTIAACQAPIVFVPNMNQAMWSDRIVQRNVRILQEVGYYVIEPGEAVEIVGLRTGGGVMPPFDSLLISLKMVMAASNA